MVNGGRTFDRDASSWLPPGMRDEPSTSPPGNGDAGHGDQASDLDQWLAVPDPDRKAPRPKRAENGVRAEPSDAEPDDAEPRDDEEADSSIDEPEPRPLSARRDRGRSPRERWQASRLRRAKEKLRAQDEVIEELRAQVAFLESELKRSSRTLKPKATDRQPEKRRPAKGKRAARPMEPSAGSTAEPKAPRKARKRGQTLDLNSASFEELRELGLTITQSARVIAYRDTRGGFGSLDELAEVPGFSRDTLGDLRSQVQI
jgi:DNA uptake protein ComE-like DNA-binding protein